MTSRPPSCTRNILVRPPPSKTWPFRSSRTLDVPETVISPSPSPAVMSHASVMLGAVSADWMALASSLHEDTVTSSAKDTVTRPTATHSASRMPTILFFILLPPFPRPPAAQERRRRRPAQIGIYTNYMRCQADSQVSSGLSRTGTVPPITRAASLPHGPAQRFKRRGHGHTQPFLHPRGGDRRLQQLRRRNGVSPRFAPPAQID